MKESEFYSILRDWRNNLNAKNILKFFEHVDDNYPEIMASINSKFMKEQSAACMQPGLDVLEGFIIQYNVEFDRVLNYSDNEGDNELYIKARAIAEIKKKIGMNFLKNNLLEVEKSLTVFKNNIDELLCTYPRIFISFGTLKHQY